MNIWTTKSTRWLPSHSIQFIACRVYHTYRSCFICLVYFMSQVMSLQSFQASRWRRCAFSTAVCSAFRVSSHQTVRQTDWQTERLTARNMCESNLNFTIWKSCLPSPSPSPSPSHCRSVTLERDIVYIRSNITPPCYLYCSGDVGKYSISVMIFNYFLAFSCDHFFGQWMTIVDLLMMYHKFYH